MSAEAGCRLANAPLLRPVVGLGWTYPALSLGYFSLCEQRKVTRAPQAIGSLAGDPSFEGLTGKRGKSLESAAVRRPKRPRLRGNDEQEQEQDQDGFQLSLE